jgi:tetratricopeptide (TPR) repeat protein
MNISLVVAIASVAAALGALMGNLLTARGNRKNLQIRQEDQLQQQIKREVEASFGTILRDLRDLELEGRKRLAEVIESIDERSKALNTEIADKESKLKLLTDQSTEQASQFEDLVARANELLPVLDTAGLIPSTILIRAQKSSDPAEKTALLNEVLEHSESDAIQLERAGDIARQELDNPLLAEALYNRAFTIDPDAITARAEYLHLMARKPREREQARTAIMELAEENPSNRTVINCFVNFLIHIDDYPTLEQKAGQLLAKSSEKALLWRNIAVARMELNKSAAEVEESFEAAFEHSDDQDFVNTARPYARYLSKLGNNERAEDIIVRALRILPSEGSLHMLRGDIHRTSGRLNEAVESYGWVTRLGDPLEKLIAERRIRDIRLLAEIGLADNAS